MSEFSLFWPTGTTGDGANTYTDMQLFSWLRRTFNSDMAADRAVLKGYNGEMAVTAGVGKVTVATGAAYVYGIPYELVAALGVTIPTPVANTRTDRIVLRADWTAKTVRVTRIAGTEGAGAPAITQSPGSVYDVKRAQVQITTGGVITVTDERQFCRFATEVATENIADGAITAAKISGGAVGTSMLADGAVTSAKIADGTIVNADISTSAAIAQSKIDNTSRAIDADKVDGYHAGTSGSQVLVLDWSGKVPLANIPTPLTGKDADTLDGQHGDYYARAAKLADMAQSKSIQVVTNWTLPTSWGDIDGLSLSITLNGTCDLHIYATLNRTLDTTGRTAYFRAKVDFIDLEVITEGSTGPRVTSGHWYFGGVGSGAHTIKLQGYGSDSSWQVSTRRLSVIVVPR